VLVGGVGTLLVVLISLGGRGVGLATFWSLTHMRFPWPEGEGIVRNQRINPKQSASAASQWFLARAFIARSSAETSRRRAIASAV
jgi:hypothetical protein